MEENKPVIIKFKNNKDIKVEELFLLKNNTFLKQEGSIGNNEYKILMLIFAKIQRQLLDSYGKPNFESIKKMGDSLTISLSYFILLFSSNFKIVLCSISWN